MTKLSPGIPTNAASLPSGESEKAHASRPHGKPPNGTEAVANSVATHRHGIHSIQSLQLEHLRREQPEDGVEEPFENRQRDRGVAADHTEPGHQDGVVRDAEAGTDQEAALDRDAVQRGQEQRYGDDREPGVVVRFERQTEQGTGGDRREQPWAGCRPRAFNRSTR